MGVGESGGGEKKHNTYKDQEFSKTDHTYDN